MIGPKLVNRSAQIRSFNTLDPATKAFINALALDGVILTPTQTRALNRLVLNYKGKGNLNTSFNFWNNSVAIYPIIGGSATAHKYNLKDPQNTNAAFRLSFSGGWTHSSNGALPNGINAFANTFIVPNSVFSNLFFTMGTYLRTNNTTTLTCDIGACNAAVSGAAELFAYLGGNNTCGIGDFANRVSYATTDTRRFKSVTRFSNSLIKSYDQGVLKNSNTNVDSSLLSGFTLPIYIGARNLANAVNSPSNREVAFGHISTNISDANMLILSNIITQFQTDLGRAV